MNARASLDVVVSGYASIDEAYQANRIAEAGQTGILRGPVHPEKSWGGCAPNAAIALARLGLRVGLVTWLGQDLDGRRYRERLRDAGVELVDVPVGPGPSPRSILIYDPRGRAACYFHPSGSVDQRLRPAAARRMRAARWLAVTVGPALLTEEVLAAAPSARVAWNVKADPEAFPPPLCRRLVAAALVCLNESELAFISEALGVPALEPEDLIGLGAGCVILTRGELGYEVVTEGERRGERVAPIEAPDPTGAGDAFFAGALAGFARGLQPMAAARAGAAAAEAHLRERLAGGVRARVGSTAGGGETPLGVAPDRRSVGRM
jgi:fructokinase